MNRKHFVIALSLLVLSLYCAGSNNTSVVFDLEAGNIDLLRYSGGKLFGFCRKDNILSAFSRDGSTLNSLVPNQSVIDFDVEGSELRFISRTGQHEVEATSIKTSTFEVLWKQVITCKDSNVSFHLSSGNHAVGISSDQITVYDLRTGNSLMIVEEHFHSVAILSNIAYVKNTIYYVSIEEGTGIALVRYKDNKKHAYDLNALCGRTFSVYSDIIIRWPVGFIINPNLAQSLEDDLSPNIDGYKVIIIDFLLMDIVKSIDLNQGEIVGVGKDYMLKTKDDNLELIRIDAR